MINSYDSMARRGFSVVPLANVVGFRSDFSLDEHVMRHDWKVQAIQEVNLFGLSKLVTIRNA